MSTSQLSFPTSSWLTGITESTSVPPQPYRTIVAPLEGDSKAALFELEILLLVLLHQSIQVMREYPSFSPLTPSEFQCYFSARLLSLLEVVCVCDSVSYSHLLFPAQTGKNRSEIQASIAGLSLN